MKITQSIQPKESLGGIRIGDEIDSIIERLSSDYTATRNTHSTVINEGLITASHDQHGIISSLSCNSKFTGRYLNKLWPGMTTVDVLRNSKVQIAWSGFIQVDSINGIGLSLPDEHDDFERLDEEFGMNFIFPELWIYP